MRAPARSVASAQRGRGRTDLPAVHVPPRAVRVAAAEGLRLHGAGYAGGTDVGLNTARILAAGKPLTLGQVAYVANYFPRHEVDRRPGWHMRKTPGYVAWLLWGGDPAREWTRKVLAGRRVPLARFLPRANPVSGGILALMVALPFVPP